MSKAKFQYDVFLSYASEDERWCTHLAERLRDSGVRVWFDKWMIRPGNNFQLLLNEGKTKSRQVIAVLSQRYFEKHWTRVEIFAGMLADPLGINRPVIPIIIEDGIKIPPLLESIQWLDFRNKDEFELRLLELLDALDLPKRAQLKLKMQLPIASRQFVSKVARLYSELGFEVEESAGNLAEEYLLIHKYSAGVPTKALVECLDYTVTDQNMRSLVARRLKAAKKFAHYRQIVVSMQKPNDSYIQALKQADIIYFSYLDLLNELVPLSYYVLKLLDDYTTWCKKHWHGEDWFIHPDILLDDGKGGRYSALDHITNWIGDRRSNLLVVLGDLGTGKSTLSRFLANKLAQSFLVDPKFHPTPILIELGHTQQQISWESILTDHFQKLSLPVPSSSSFDYLLRQGQMVLLLDGFDEMADRVRMNVARQNFRELFRAVGRDCKVMLTCRTEYFRNRAAEVFLFGNVIDSTDTENNLRRELAEGEEVQEVEVVYLVEFSDEQIRAYLTKARPQTVDADLQKIEAIYNLKELAHRPLLLELIVRSLPKLEQDDGINVANLYKVYTDLWIKREEGKGRLLNRQIKFGLMKELAWWLWRDNREAVHFRYMWPFIQGLVERETLEFDGEDAWDVTRELEAASFLKRDAEGNFSFADVSFREFFLARKLYDALTVNFDVDHVEFLQARPYERNVIRFLAALDPGRKTYVALQRILTGAYHREVSENALHILYWSARFRCAAETEINDLESLRAEMKTALPPQAQLVQADLQGMDFEALTLSKADFRTADLRNINFKAAQLHDCNFRQARLQGASFEGADLTGSDFGEAQDFTPTQNR